MPIPVTTVLARLAILAVLVLPLAPPARADAVGRAPEPFVVEYYYKARWGHGPEFVELFRKNHYPLLKKQQELGRIVRMSAEAPFYHPVEEGRWDLRVTVAWKDAIVAHDDFDLGDFVKETFPDQEAFRKEEARRFGLLEAHWDTVVVPVDLDKP